MMGFATLYRYALYTVRYDYMKQHKRLKELSPAAARLSDPLWSMTDLAEMVDAAAPMPRKCGPDKAKVAQLRGETQCDSF